MIETLWMINELPIFVRRGELIWTQALTTVCHATLGNVGLHFYVIHWSSLLTHWGRATHLCVSNLTIIASDNGLSPGRRQAIIWTNAGILLIGPLAINFSEILIEIQIVSFKKMYLKLSSAKWRLLRLGLNVLRTKETVVAVLLLSVSFVILNVILSKILASNFLQC